MLSNASVEKWYQGILLVQCINQLGLHQAVTEQNRTITIKG